VAYWVFLVLTLPLGLGIPGLALTWLVGHLRASTDPDAFYARRVPGGTVRSVVWAGIVVAGFCIIEAGLIAMISSCVDYLAGGRP